MCFCRLYVNFIQGTVMNSAGLFVFKGEAVAGKCIYT